MCVIHFIHFHIVYWFLSGMKINLRLPIDRSIIRNMQWLLIKIKQCNPVLLFFPFCIVCST